jgi:hypothetical protein
MHQMSDDQSGAEDQASGDDQAADGQPVPLNREQRRAQKFKHGHDSRQDNLRPQSENNSAFNAPVTADAEEGPKDAVTAANTQGETNMTGAGTGGAVESDGRLPHHEGMHLGNQPNS